MLKPGDKAPSFKLMSEQGEVKSAGLKGKRYVMYFYPADDTPGCTKEACSFRDNLPKFHGSDVTVYGISADDVKSHGKFTPNIRLTFRCWPTQTHSDRWLWRVGREEHVWQKIHGHFRSTFVVGVNGKVEHVWEKVRPKAMPRKF